MESLTLNAVQAPKKITYKKLTRSLCKRFKTKMPIGREQKNNTLLYINYMVLEGTTYDHINFALEHDEEYLLKNLGVHSFVRQLSPGEFPGDHDLADCIVVVSRIGNVMTREAVIPTDEHGDIIKIPGPIFN